MDYTIELLTGERLQNSATQPQPTDAEVLDAYSRTVIGKGHGKPRSFISRWRSR